MIHILFLSANPLDHDHLRIAQERREIQRALNSAEDGKRFKLIEASAVNASELQELLFQHKPQIVHFSGHGEEGGELFFEDDDGNSQPVTPQALGDLFAKFKATVHCVLLNACYSHEHATALAQQIDCVIGMNDRISDPAALSFATAFYRALTNQRTLGDAFDLARNQLDLQGIDEAQTPQLLAERIDTAKVKAMEWDEVEKTEAPTPTNQFNTAGGAGIAHDANVTGDFVNRDKIEGDKVEGDKFTGNKTVIQQQNVYHYPPLAIRSSQFAIQGIFGQYPFNEQFFGRDDALADLHTLLQTENTVSICPVITGMGGLGKTQLAAHYARRHTGNYPDGIFWVTAADLNSMRGQLADFCVALDLQVADPQRTGDLSEQKITAFKRYLDEHPRALLIFDNVEEPDHLRTRQIGVGLTALTLGGKLIVTTRRRKLSSDRFVELPLQRLLPAPARQILLAARDELRHDPDLDRLCEQFGYLPLMLNLAAAALKKRGGAIVGYLQRLHTLGAEKLHNDVAKVSLDDYHKSLSAVLHEQWARLGDENARLLFRVAGQLPEAEVIPIARLGLLADLQDVDEWERPLSDALEELERASLIEGRHNQAIYLHPLVHKFANDIVGKPEQRHELLCRISLNIISEYESGNRFHLNLEPYELRQELMLGLNFVRQMTDDLEGGQTADLQALALKERLKKLVILIAYEFVETKACEDVWSNSISIQQLLYRSCVLNVPALQEKAEKVLNEKGLARVRPLWIKPQYIAQMNIESLNDEIGMRIGSELRIVSFPSGRLWRIINKPQLPKLRIVVDNLSTDSNPKLDRYLDIDHEDSIDSIEIIGKRIITGSSDGTLKVWDIENGTMKKTLVGHKRSVKTIAALNSQHVISGSSDQTLRIWNIKTGESEKSLSGHKGPIQSISILNEQHVVSSANDCTFRIWNIHTGQLVKTIYRHDRESTFITSSKLDAQRLLTASDDNTIKIWNLVSGQVEQVLKGHTNLVIAIALLDTQRFISGSMDHTIMVWNLSTNEPEQKLVAHTDSVNSLSVIDANRIASVSDDNTLKVWDLQNEHVLASIRLDNAPQCVKVTRFEGRIMMLVGDKLGGLYCLELVEAKS